MSTILQAAVVYFTLLGLLRLAGRRTFADLTTFDFVLLLVIGETTQQALMGGTDPSLTTYLLVVTTLIGLDVLFAFAKLRFQALNRIVEGLPLILVREGVPDAGLMRKARVTLEDVLAAGRISQGVGSLEEIRFAVLEANGQISVIPRREG